jgi:hypothetical protein
VVEEAEEDSMTNAKEDPKWKDRKIEKGAIT